MCEIGKLRLLCQEHHALLCRVRHGHELVLRGEALLKSALVKDPFHRLHLAVISGEGFSVGIGAPAGERLKIQLQHAGDLPPESAETLRKILQPLHELLKHGMSLCASLLHLGPLLQIGKQH
ncbi:hypothetical protein SDC9_125857 [bioreactor metagenome]|uniref:Uncharacterized protein n=1 Tax=bioreactor metagenome TaxID=1076179 RepID=A0A645CQ39_9ZZZZ